MKILWIPQLPVGSQGWEGSRHYHLLSHLARRHDIHVISWKHARRPADLARLGRHAPNGAAPVVEHSVVLAPTFYRMIRKTYPRSYHLWLNERLFQRAVNEVAAAVRPDVCLFSSSHHATGFPPAVEAPMLFDYLDSSPGWVEQFYLQNAAAVAAISERLTEAGRRFHKPTFLIPNGVDLERYRTTCRRQAKEKLGLEGHTVVSLIGLTCSSKLYFVDAMAAVQSNRPDVVFLVAGSGALLDAIVRRAEQLGIRNLHAPGWIPNAQVHTYFAASDVGLYPGEDTAYYRQALPLKILEYAAAGAQVVSSPVEAFENGWPNVRITQPGAGSFAAAIEDAIERAHPVPDMTSYSWESLACRLGQIFETIAR